MLSIGGSLCVGVDVALETRAFSCYAIVGLCKAKFSVSRSCHEYVGGGESLCVSVALSYAYGGYEDYYGVTGSREANSGLGYAKACGFSLGFYRVDGGL